MTGSDIGWATDPNLRYLPTPGMFFNLFALKNDLAAVGKQQKKVSNV
jgi:hypothetical protein